MSSPSPFMFLPDVLFNLCNEYIGTVIETNNFCFALNRPPEFDEEIDVLTAICNWIANSGAIEVIPVDILRRTCPRYKTVGEMQRLLPTSRNLVTEIAELVAVRDEVHGHNLMIEFGSDVLTKIYFPALARISFKSERQQNAIDYILGDFAIDYSVGETELSPEWWRLWARVLYDAYDNDDNDVILWMFCYHKVDLCVNLLTNTFTAEPDYVYTLLRFLDVLIARPDSSAPLGVLSCHPDTMYYLKMGNYVRAAELIERRRQQCFARK